MKGTIRALVLAFVLALTMTLPVEAAPALDTAAECSLTLVHSSASTPLPGAEVRLYRVADLDRTGAASLSGDFAGYPVSLRRLDADGWTAAANTLAVYVTADSLTPLTAGTTDASGQAAFSGLRTGLYLVLVGDTRQGNTDYHTAPFLTAVPGLENEQWSYDLTVRTKVQETTRPGGGDGDGGGDEEPSTTAVTVLKVWNDEQQDRRPESIRVTLLRDGRDYRTVTLNAGNNWRYTWEDLSSRYAWSVVEEDVPEGYTVIYTGSESRLVITNTYETDIPETTPPLGAPPEDTEPGTDLPEEPVPTDGRLPQTGLLWWPVPLLATAGVLLFSLGWWQRTAGRKHEET